MTIPGARRRCAVLGSPITHSLSPALHRAGYAATGLDWEYDAREVAEDDLADFLDGLDDTWRGLSLTMPLKRSVIRLADELTPQAALAGAANTLLLENGHRSADNTDIPGAVAAIRERTAEPIATGSILGGGATATSTALALANLGCRDITVVVRSEARAAETVAAVRRHPAGPTVRVAGFGDAERAVDVLVSTIPAAAQTPEVVRLARPVDLIFDVVYDPWPTPLARFAHGRNRTLVSGLDLLVHQAAEQFVLMTGHAEAPLAAMRAAGERELADRANRT